MSKQGTAVKRWRRWVRWVLGPMRWAHLLPQRGRSLRWPRAPWRAQALLTRARPQRAPARPAEDLERGDAIIEFVAFVVILVVPALYFVLTLAKVQAGIFAVELASRDAARVLARDPDAIVLAEAKADLAFEDFGVAQAASIDVGCTVCSGQGRDVRVTALVHVQWPLIPEWVTAGAIPIESSVTLPVEEVVLK